MEYFLSPASIQNNFIVPANVADKHLKLAGAVQLKVLLYALRNLADDPSQEQISAALNIPVADVNDSLRYWADAGVLISKNSNPADFATQSDSKQNVKNIRPAAVLPTREEVARRASENEQIAFLLQEAQLKFGRLLKNSEASTLVWLFDDKGMDISLILMLIEYAVNEKKCNISFIERTAIDWLNNDIHSITDADKYLAAQYRKKTAWKIVENSFGIEDRLPSKKELDLSEKWLNEWKFDREILTAAYEKCVDTKSKFIMSYVAKILEDWHKKGITTLDGIKAEDNSHNAAKNSANSFSTHDISLMEEMINKGYQGE